MGEFVCSPNNRRYHSTYGPSIVQKGSRAQLNRLVHSHERRIARGLSSDETRLLIALLEKVRIAAGPL
jgi:hypothetical protein